MVRSSKNQQSRSIVFDDRSSLVYQSYGSQKDMLNARYSRLGNPRIDYKNMKVKTIKEFRAE